MPSWVSHAPIASHGRRRLEAENLVLRHQLNVLQQRAPRRLYLRWADRALFVWLYRRCPRILDAITIVRPETVVRWHRMGFAAYWRSRARRLAVGAKLRRPYRNRGRCSHAGYGAATRGRPPPPAGPSIRSRY